MTLAIPHRAGGADTQSDFSSDCMKMTPSKEFSCKMTENMQVDALPSRQAGFVRCCLNNSVSIRRRGDDFEKSTYELQQKSNGAA